MEFARHFPEREMNPLGFPLAPAVRDNLAALSWLLEAARAALGNYPLIVTSGYRTAAYNATLPDASDSSQHIDGTAADFRLPAEVSQAEAYRLLTYGAMQNARLRWGELIFYPWTKKHVHISLPTRTERQLVLVQRQDKSYATLTDVVAATFPGGSAPGAGKIALASAALGFVVLKS